MKDYEVSVRFPADTPEEANSLACDVEQVLSGRSVSEFLGGDRFPHDVTVTPAQPAGPKVEVIHDRDPDSACDLQVYIDGVLVQHREYSLDPGAGYTKESWEEDIEATQADTEMTPAIKEQLLERYEELKDSKWNLD